MKRFLVIVLLIISVGLQAQIEQAVPNAPVPPALVNDFTGNFLTPEQKAALENKLKLYDDTTSNQITVVIVNDLQGYEPADYAMAIGRKWGVGNKQFDNGIVLLVSTGGGEGNRAVFIATGYGLEGAVTDLLSKTIIDNAIIPNFRQQNYYRGLDEGTDAIIEAAEGRYTAPEGYANRGEGDGISPMMIFLAIIIAIIIISMISKGGGGGGYVSRRGYRGWDGPFVGGNWGGWSGGGGGGWSGGGGGGGFGGFGGGGFGGGGAGGSW